MGSIHPIIWESKSSAQSKPTPLPVLAESIPDTIRSLARWVIWRYEWDGKGSRWSKVPYTPLASTRASSTDPSTWASHEDALASYRMDDTDGIGLMLVDDGLIGIDLDKCRNPQSGEIDTWAQDIIGRFGSYTEVSPSGTGVRIFCCGEVNLGTNGQGVSRKGRRSGPVEIYLGARYLTVTGHRVEGTPDEMASDASDALAWLIQTHIENRQHHLEHSGCVARTERACVDDLDDGALLDRLFTMRGGDKYARLWDGDVSGYTSDSEADLALLNGLLFITNRDANRAEAMFGRSQLGQRAKWTQRGDYRARTTQKALDSLFNGYDPPRSESKAKNSHQDCSVTLGGLRLDVLKPKRTASGQIKTTVGIFNGEKKTNEANLTASAASKRDLALYLQRILSDRVSRRDIDEAIGRLLVIAGEVVDRGPAGTTIADIVAQEVPAKLDLRCRTLHNIWSEEDGREIDRHSFVMHNPPSLLAKVSKASDAPGTDRIALVRSLQTELGVLYSHLRETLPRETDAYSLDADTKRARSFRDTVCSLFTRPVAGEIIKGADGDRVKKAPLAGIVQQAIYHGRSNSPHTWSRITSTYLAWWRLRDSEPEIAFSPLLHDQIGVILPGVHSAEDLLILGVRYGALATGQDAPGDRLILSQTLTNTVCGSSE